MSHERAGSLLLFLFSLPDQEEDVVFFPSVEGKSFLFLGGGGGGLNSPMNPSVSFI